MKSHPQRAEFPKAVKRALAERNSFRCSFPGCTAITIGPGHKNDLQSVNSGQAAHIYSAAENGPRPNPALSKEKRSSIDNGIWMCNYHAGIIDADECQYSAETLHQWKTQAVERAHKEQISLNGTRYETDTFIGIGHIIFAGAWVSVSENNWVFEAKTFVQATLAELITYISDFEKNPFSSKYVVVESQGDGRLLASLSTQMENGKLLINCNTHARSPRKNLSEIGSDIALNDNLDIDLGDGDFKTISGMELALQELRMALSKTYGGFPGLPNSGSIFYQIYNNYRSDPSLLNRLTKMELIRLITMPYKDAKMSPPLLDFIEKVEQVEVKKMDIQNGFIPVYIHLQWADKSLWQGEICVYVREQN